MITGQTSRSSDTVRYDVFNCLLRKKEREGERERDLSLSLSDGGEKRVEYSDKTREVRAMNCSAL